MKNLNDISLSELTASEIHQIDGGQLTKNEARVVAFCLGGLIGLGLFELSSSLPK
jgi:hypothetical protein